MKQKEAIPCGNEWKEKNIKEFSASPFVQIGTDAMLITAGDVEKDKGNWNTMTASWGGFGVLFHKDVVFMFIRPQRQTKIFVEENSIFTLSFFPESHADIHKICGSKSGKDTDKAAETGLTPIFFKEEPIAGAVSFKEANEIIICKKLYSQDMVPASFIDTESREKFYKANDFHCIYVGEILGYRTK